MKSRKIKIKKSGIILLILLILAILLYKPVSSIIKLKIKGYSISSSYKIYKEGIKDETLDNNYSKILDSIIDTKEYDKKYLENYFEINYIKRDNYLKEIANMLKLGYTSNDINKIYEINNEEIIKKVNEKYIADILKYLNYDFFKVDKLDRYLTFFNGDYKDTIIKVNIGLDKDYYQNPEIIKEYSIEMLVNKYNKLDSNLEPKEITELTKCSEKGHYLSKDAKLAYDELCDASLKDGMSLGVTSSYRSYESQKNIYDSYLKTNGQDYVNKYVATPGYSEHQTGLALDVKSTKSSPFKYTKEYKWMQENAYKYGFILRYPEGLEEITGYNAESWHYRYVGKEIANYIHENNITYDEYCAIFM